MLNGSILPKMLRFAAPLALSGILQLLFNAADVIVLGRYVGPDALAAVGSTASLTNLLVNFFIAYSVGVNVIVSTAYAQGKSSEVSKTVNTSILFAFLCGIFLIFAGYFISRPMLVAMGTPDNVLPLSVTYVRIYFGAMPFVMVYNFGAAILRSIGDTRRPFFYLLIAGIVNVCLNLYFVLRLDMGVAGVAIATDISNAICAVLVVLTLSRENSCLKVTLKELRLDPQVIRKITKVGLPAGIQSVLFNISNVIIQSSVNSFGSLTMAANAASINLEGFYATAMSSISSSVVSFISQNNGAGKYSRLNRVIRSSLFLVFCVSVVFGSLFLLFGTELLSVYTDNPEVAEIGMQRLVIFACSYFLGSFMDCMSGALRGLGHGVLPMAVTIVGVVVFRFFWIFVVFAQNHSYPLLIAGYPISWAITFLVLLFCYREKRRKLPAGDDPEISEGNVR